VSDSDFYLEPPEPPNTFYNPENTKEEALRLQDTANQMNHPTKCVFCKNNFFWLAGDRAWCGGQIYSQMGKRETSISQMCEFCFDTVTLTDREENPKLYDHYEALKSGGESQA
jgi:hypothetical protein